MNTRGPQLRTADNNIDIQVEGKQHGHLTLPCASAKSALGTVQIPICVIRNGDGPVACLVAGARGDEFDGRVALHALINQIAVDEVSGCLIIVPTLNPLAAASGSRHSPVDNQDLNQCFPGNAEGSITQTIAAHIIATIIEPAELIIELQSGGESTRYTPMAAVHFNADKDLQQRSEQSMIAFGAPYSARLLPEHQGSLSNAASSFQKEYVLALLGGGASTHANAIEVALTGCKNALVQLGLLKQELVLRSTRMLEVASENNYVIAPCAGLLEMCKEPGEEVYMGSPVARIIQPGHTGMAASILKANRNGILMARHCHGYIEQGDCVAVVADEVQR